MAPGAPDQLYTSIDQGPVFGYTPRPISVQLPRKLSAVETFRVLYTASIPDNLTP
jgi:hypothetical protein